MCEAGVTDTVCELAVCFLDTRFCKNAVTNRVRARACLGLVYASVNPLRFPSPPPGGGIKQLLLNINVNVFGSFSLLSLPKKPILFLL